MKTLIQYPHFKFVVVKEWIMQSVGDIGTDDIRCIKVYIHYLPIRQEGILVWIWRKFMAQKAPLVGHH